jgi:polyhydroxyalkanoate synthase
MLTDNELEFVLVSGGHNVGIVCPPDTKAPAHFQAATRKRGEKYRDAEYWKQHAAAHDGSWWPYWDHWLGAHSKGSVAARRTGPADQDQAPGTYVMQR